MKNNSLGVQRFNVSYPEEHRGQWMEQRVRKRDGEREREREEEKERERIERPGRKRLEGRERDQR